MSEMAPEQITPVGIQGGESLAEPEFPGRVYTTSIKIIGFASSSHVEIGYDGQTYYDC